MYFICSWKVDVQGSHNKETVPNVTKWYDPIHVAAAGLYLMELD